MDAWTALGREVASIGIRWLVLGGVVMTFGGFFGRRYRHFKMGHRDLKRDQHELKDEFTDLKGRLAVSAPPPTGAGGDVTETVGNSTTVINEAQLQTPQKLDTLPGQRLRVIHIATKHCDLNVRFSSVEQATEDIHCWLANNELRAGVSPNTQRDVLKRAASIRR